MKVRSCWKFFKLVISLISLLLLASTFLIHLRNRRSASRLRDFVARRRDHFDAVRRRVASFAVADAHDARVIAAVDRRLSQRLASIAAGARRRDLIVAGIGDVADVGGDLTRAVAAELSRRLGLDLGADDVEEVKREGAILVVTVMRTADRDAILRRFEALQDPADFSISARGLS